MASERPPILDALTTGRLYSRAEVLANPSPLPKVPGIYAWWFRDTLGVPLQGCEVRDGLTLLCVGISPHRLAAPGHAAKQSIGSRVRYHYSGTAEGSTLRLILGTLLEFELRRVGSGKRRTFAEDEVELSTWMGANAFVSILEDPKPWLLEKEMFGVTSLPLNLDQQGHGLFHNKLTALLRANRERALELPVI